MTNDGEPGSTPIAMIQRRARRAVRERQRIEPLLRDLYDYVLPYRTAGDAATPGEAYTDHLFDATGVDGAFRFAGRMQQAVTPEGFFALEPGPALERMLGDDKSSLARELEAITGQVSAALKTGDFDLATHEMYTDLFGGTGAMMMRAGDARQPVRCVSAPAMELALERSPLGGVGAVHWTRKYQASELPDMWPDGRWDDETANKIRSEQDSQVEVCQSTTWNRRLGLWELTVFKWQATETKPGEVRELVPVERFRSTPWITPRFWVVPGEVWGRGPGMVALPFLKTLNKAQELDLKAAAMALFGLYAVVDDGVFNPSTASFEPGGMWPVRATGGVLGPSIQKLDVPGKYDLSRFVVEDQRAQANAVMFARRLPSEAGAVRSPTEIMERIRDIDLDMSGVYGRLKFEVIVPIVARTIEILERVGVLDTRLTIDQLTVGLRVVSPAARAKQSADAQPMVNYASLVASIAGPQSVPLYLDPDTALPELGTMLGVAERHKTSPAKREALKKQMAEAEMARLSAEAAVKQPPAEQPDPNGAAV